jgi:hypothetical protein
MARSLGLILAIVVVTLLFVPGLIHPSKSEKFQPVDYSNYLSGFDEVTGKSALAPAPPPSSWRANGATLTGPATAEHLHIGFAVPGTKYAGLEEGVAPASTFVRSVLGSRGAIVTDHLTLHGVAWASSTSSRGEFALTRTVGGITIIVTGSATPLQLETLAASLH